MDWRWGGPPISLFRFFGIYNTDLNKNLHTVTRRVARFILLQYTKVGKNIPYHVSTKWPISRYISIPGQVQKWSRSKSLQPNCRYKWLNCLNEPNWTNRFWPIFTYRACFTFQGLALSEKLVGNQDTWSQSYDFWIYSYNASVVVG
jgi:hypothetical protein